MNQPERAADTLPQILCIDDDSDVLAGLALSLRGLGEIHTASGGSEALAVADGLDRLAVVLCDMRMPGMTGDQVLAAFNARHPLAVRLLLTGYSDTAAAIRAINDGRIFRFLGKPCPREQLQQALREALAQHTLLRTEQELLEQTVRGCTQALVDALCIASPATYGRADRLRDLLRRVSERSRLQTGWATEMAAMLASLGLVGLRQSLQEKVLFDLPLEAGEAEEISQAQRRSFALLQRIPRLDPVLRLITLTEPALADAMRISPEDAEALAPQAHLIRIIRQYVRHESSGMPALQSLEALRGEFPGSTALIAALRDVLGEQADVDRVIELPLDMLGDGMVLARAIHTQHGLLFAPAGYQVRPGFKRRLLDACPHLRRERIAVIIPPEAGGHIHHQLLTEG